METETPVGIVPGVITTPDEKVHPSIKASVDKILNNTLEPNETAAVVSVLTPKGFNIAFAARVADRWTVVTWVGKEDGWSQPLAHPDAGVYVKWRAKKR